MAELEALLNQLDRDGGGELLVQAGSPPLARIGGRRRWLADEPLSAAEAEELALAGLSPELREQLDADLELTTVHVRPDRRRVRATHFRHAGGVATVFRTLPARCPTAAELGLPDAVVELAERRSGLVLVAGPPGSGRTATIAALLGQLGESRPCHVATFEEAIELHHRPTRAQVTQREIGVSALAGALFEALRDDVDVIVVDPLRGVGARRAAIELAATGRLVLAVVPGATVTQALARFVDGTAGDDRAEALAAAADVLAAVSVQHLVPRKDGGRVAAFEVALSTSALSALVRSDRLDAIVALLRHGQALGMQTLDAALERLVVQGAVDYDAALPLATDRETFERAIGARG